MSTAATTDITVYSGIYSISFDGDERVYIGKALDIVKWFWIHFSTLNKNAHENIELQRAWNKYGESNFLFEILEACPYEKLWDRELKQYLEINKNRLYNNMQEREI